MSWANCEDIYDRLDRLSDYETISTFSIAYYDAIAEYVAGGGRPAQGLRLRLVEFLDVMEQYHRALAVFSVENQVTLGNVRSAAQKRDIGLRLLLEQLQVDRTRGEVEIARLLLVAECYYQIALHERVVETLDLAVQAGADHPMVCFALGYNRYELAMRTFTRYDDVSGELVVHDEDRFRLACLASVSSLQDGLTGGRLDGHLHWWIGNILEAAGFGEAAGASFARARELEENAKFVEELEEAAILLSLEIDTEYEDEAGGKAGPISEDEVDQAGLLLRLSYTQSEILNG
jgi:hypothetical protein